MFTLPEIMEMLGDDNRYYASQALGREATPAECVFHWINHKPCPPRLKSFEVEETLFDRKE